MLKKISILILICFLISVNVVAAEDISLNTVLKEIENITNIANNEKRFEAYDNLANKLGFTIIEEEKTDMLAFNELTSEYIVTELQKDLPMTNIKIFNAENDPNEFLGRPGQYIGKASWNDSRLEETKGTVEVFKNQKDLQNRKKYLESVFEEYPTFLQYMYVHKNAILRIEKKLLPDQAKDYETNLNKL